MSDNNKTPVVATMRISYGPKEEDQILPATVFAPADHGLDIVELRELKAVEDCSDADIALYEQQHGSAKPLTKAQKAAAEKEAAEKAEAEAAEAAAAEAAAAEAAAAEAAAAEAAAGSGSVIG